MKIIQHKLIHFALFSLCIWTLDVQSLDKVDTDQPFANPKFYSNTPQTLKKLIRQVMKQNHIVGLSIALVDDQTLIWSQGFGYADVEKGIKATSKTLYRAGSISKLFTATAAMQMFEQSQFDIDQPLQSYLPDFFIKTRFPNTVAITPRQLMTHHSGLPSDWFKGVTTTAPPEPFDQLPEKLSDEYTAYPPNFLMSYSNLGVSLLGAALQNVCGGMFKDCLQRQLLQPLGMVDSEFATTPSKSPLMSKGYSQGVAVPEPYLRDVPAGGLNSNVLDLSRFMQMVFAGGKSVIAAPTLAEMLRPQNIEIALDLDHRIGLAWMLGYSASGDLFAWHNGGIGNFHSMLATLPEQKLGVVVLANSDTAAGVVEQLGSAALLLMSEEKFGQAAAINENLALPPISFNNFPGYYASENHGLIRITKTNGRLQIELDKKNYLLEINADGQPTFNSPELGIVILSRAKLSEHQVLIALLSTNRELLGEKISPTLLAENWLQRVGKYQILNRGHDAASPKTIRIDVQYGSRDAPYGFLTMAATGLSATRILLPVSDSEAVIAGLGRYLGETVKFESQGGETLIRYSGFIAKKS